MMRVVNLRDETAIVIAIIDAASRPCSELRREPERLAQVSA